MCPKKLILAAAAMSMFCPRSRPLVAEMQCETGATGPGQALNKNSTLNPGTAIGRSSVCAYCYLKDSPSKDSLLLSPGSVFLGLAHAIRSCD